MPSPSLCESFVVPAIEVSARAYFLSSSLRHFCLCDACVLLASEGWEQFIDDVFLVQKSKNSSPAGSHTSSYSHRRSGSAGSNTAAVGVGLDSSGTGDYRLHPTLTDDQASHLS